MRDSKFCLNLIIPLVIQRRDGTDSCDDLGDFVFDYLYLFPFGHEGGSSSCSEGLPAQVSFHANLFGDSKEELFQDGLAYLAKLGAPKDTFLQKKITLPQKFPRKNSYGGRIACRSSEFAGGGNRIFGRVIQKVGTHADRGGLAYSCTVGSRIAGFGGNNALHLAAKEGKLNLVNLKCLRRRTCWSPTMRGNRFEGWQWRAVMRSNCPKR